MDAPKSVVLSHALWSRRYHADPAIVGRVILIDAVAHTVIGVMPSDFSYPPGNPVLWRILTMREPARRGPFYSWGIARLKPGVGMNELHANLGIVAADLKRHLKDKVGDTSAQRLGDALPAVGSLGSAASASIAR